MPFAQIGKHRIHYELEGSQGEAIAFINGLTQSTQLWATYREKLAAKGYCVLTYDMLGQGESSKPVLWIEFEDHADIFVGLLDHLGIKNCHLAGISFGGSVALRTAIRHPQRVETLVPMSTFAELTPQLEHIGAAFHFAITQAGFPLVQKLLLPMNLSGEWLARNRAVLPELVRRGYATNDPYAIQNLIESLARFKPFTSELAEISCPTLILNGEFDFLTPRECHDVLRRGIRNSRFMIIPRGYHAFTLEMPDLVMRLIDGFVRTVKDGKWQGDQTVWLASEDLASEVLATRIVGDHMRAVPLPAGATQGLPQEWLVPLAGTAL